jgi:hypothetical protein
MDWKYHIPHLWEPGKRVPWAEVWLLPEDPRLSSRSICLTVDALGDASDPTQGSDRAAFQKEALEKLNDNSHWIGGAEMIVRVRDFGRMDFLEWVTVWLQKNDPHLGTLSPGSFEEFSGTSRDAKLIERILSEYPDASAGPSVH